MRRIRFRFVFILENEIKNKKKYKKGISYILFYLLLFSLYKKKFNNL